MLNMVALDRPAVRMRWEALGVSLLLWAALVSIPLALGRIGISWDALNHHIYLGWTAQRPRFDRDVLASSYQAFQFPYLYWPVYKLAALGVSGAAAGVVLASLQALAAPAVWMIARACIPGAGWLDVVLRMLAVVLGFLSIVVLSMFDSTSNDLLAAVPLVWSIALAVWVVGDSQRTPRQRTTLVALSGLLAGVSVAAKLSNGPLAVLGVVLWVMCATDWKGRFGAVILGSACAGLGFLLAYGHWGWQLWVNVGNPVYPFGDAYFEPLRQWMGWHP